MELVQPGGGGGSGTALTVTDGVTPVVNVSTINFTAGATVTSGGAGVANVNVTGTGGGFAVLVPTGTIDGVNRTFTFASAPQVVVVDNTNTLNKQNKAPDSTANWTGTTVVVLAVAPTFNIFGF